jgi:hypothetical protein
METNQAKYHFPKKKQEKKTHKFPKHMNVYSSKQLSLFSKMKKLSGLLELLANFLIQIFYVKLKKKAKILCFLIFF